MSSVLMVSSAMGAFPSARFARTRTQLLEPAAYRPSITVSPTWATRPALDRRVDDDLQVDLLARRPPSASARGSLVVGEGDGGRTSATSLLASRRLVATMRVDDGRQVANPPVGPTIEMSRRSPARPAGEEVYDDLLAGGGGHMGSANLSRSSS